MSPADQFLARAAELAQRLGVPFVIAVMDSSTTPPKRKLVASPGALEQLKPLLLQQLGAAGEKEKPEEIPEVGWGEGPAS